LEGVQKLLAQENGMWRTLRMIDDYCENEIARVNHKEEKEEPKGQPREALKCQIGKPGCVDCMTVEEL